MHYKLSHLNIKNALYKLLTHGQAFIKEMTQEEQNKVLRG